MTFKIESEVFKNYLSGVRIMPDLACLAGISSLSHPPSSCSWWTSLRGLLSGPGRTNFVALDMFHPSHLVNPTPVKKVLLPLTSTCPAKSGPLVKSLLASFSFPSWHSPSCLTALGVCVSCWCGVAVYHDCLYLTPGRHWKVFVKEGRLGDSRWACRGCINNKQIIQ